MTPTITLPEKQNSISEYSEEMNNFFLKNTVMIKTFPSEFSDISELEFPNFQITSADQYIEYLENEIKFWQENDSKNELVSISKSNVLNVAKTHFVNAVNQSKSTNSNKIANIQSDLRQSISTIENGVLYSKTKLASEIIKFVGKNSGFIQGFKLGIQNNQNQSISNSTSNLEGYFVALSYKGILKETFKSIGQNNSEAIIDNISSANEKLSSLNETFVKAVQDQENRLKAIHLQTEEKLKELNDASIQHHEEAKRRFELLEKSYNEHLKLKEPAQYWNTMEEHYTTKGRLWLTVSIVFTCLIVAGLVMTLIYIPNIFSEDTHWFDLFKNSAIVTITASVAIYLLRIFIKLSMSSFHLARDAKERNSLCYLFLALVRDGSVTDKERSIVLTALFSRSDTGLLKGDSGPTMPSGILTEMLDAIKK